MKHALFTKLGRVLQWANIRRFLSRQAEQSDGGRAAPTVSASRSLDGPRPVRRIR